MKIYCRHWRMRSSSASHKDYRLVVIYQCLSRAVCWPPRRCCYFVDVFIVLLFKIICMLLLYVAYRWNEFCAVGRYHRNHTTGLQQRLCFIHYYRLSKVIQPLTRHILLALLANNSISLTQYEQRAQLLHRKSKCQSFFVFLFLPWMTLNDLEQIFKVTVTLYQFLFSG